MPTIASVLSGTAQRHPDLVGLRCGSLELTYEQWDRNSSAIASGLRQVGIGAGDRVALLQENGPAFLQTLFGIFKAGAVAVPINSKLHPLEYRYIIDHCGARAVFFTPALGAGLDPSESSLPSHLQLIAVRDAPAWASPLEEMLADGDPTFVEVERDPDDVCWLFYTSGTTGRPKGAMITHANLEFMVAHYKEEVRAVTPGEVVLHLAPLTHAGGLWALPLTSAGATHLLPEHGHFDPAGALRLVEEQRPEQIVFVSPTMITMLSEAYEQQATDVSSLRLVGYGGSPIPTPELERAVRNFGSVFCQIYGQGECPMTITMLSPHDHVVDPGAVHRLSSAGRRRRDIQVEVLGDQGEVAPAGVIGEVVVAGPVVMKGYWEHPEATAEAFAGGWYHTGDVGYFDDDGYLYLLDRLKDLIITGGSNVYGREVEEVLARHPGIAEVAVIGLPDPKWVEVVTAVIVPAPDGPPPDVSDLKALCDTQLARFKHPRRWEFVAGLPRSSYGKVLKRELRRELQQALVSEDEVTT